MTWWLLLLIVIGAYLLIGVGIAIFINLTAPDVIRAKDFMKVTIAWLPALIYGYFTGLF